MFNLNFQDGIVYRKFTIPVRKKASSRWCDNKDKKLLITY